MQAKTDGQLSQEVSTKKLFEYLKDATANLGTLLKTEEEDNRQEAKNELKRISYSSPRFFTTPYTSYEDFGLTFSSPIVAPLTVGLVASTAAVVAAVSAIAAVGGLLVTGGVAFAKLFTKDADPVIETAANVFVLGGIVATLAALATAILAVVAAVLAPLALAAFVTRSVATLVSPTVDFFSKCCKGNDEDKSHEDEVSLFASV